MFPIGDENRGQRLRPLVNNALIVLNVVVFLYEFALPERGLIRFINRWGAIPERIVDGADLVTLVSSQFLHGGWLHLLSNMLFLWVFGDNIEDTMGHLGYLAFYLLAGVIAALAQVVVEPSSGVPLVGASGAISGVLGAYIVLFPKGKIRTAFLIYFIPLIFLIPAWIQIGIWILLQFVNGFAALAVTTQETGGGGVAYFAHIGGFVAGLLLVWVFRDETAHRRQLAAREGRRAFERVSWGRQ